MENTVEQLLLENANLKTQVESLTTECSAKTESIANLKKELKGLTTKLENKDIALGEAQRKFKLLALKKPEQAKAIEEGTFVPNITVEGNQANIAQGQFVRNDAPIVIFMQDFFNKNVEICRKKNNDYTGGSKDPFANFTAIEKLGIRPEIGFITRMMDKMMRISTYANGGDLKVSDESVIDTLSDLANYSGLLAGYITRNKWMHTVTSEQVSQQFRKNLDEADKEQALLNEKHNSQ